LRKGLDRHTRLQRDLDLLRAKAGKEKQINRRVELNLEIKAIESKLAEITVSLGDGNADESN
jgi:hypothetical protein